jgi:hypothetical protein
MSEHWRGVDEADVVRALRRAAAADTGVDVSALAAGARGRARTIRRRRQGVAGVVAVLALGVPIGISQWTGVNPPAVVRPADPTAVAIPDSVLLTDADVAAVIAGLEPTEVDVAPNYGLCAAEAYPDTDSVVDVRSSGWGGQADVLDAPVPQAVQVDVLLFRGDAAQDWTTQTQVQADSCRTEAPESAPWTLTSELGLDADQVVAGSVQAIDTGAEWTAAVVARRAQLVVRVEVTAAVPTSSDALSRATELARTALDKAAALQDAGGAAR